LKYQPPFGNNVSMPVKLASEKPLVPIAVLAVLAFVAPLKAQSGFDFQLTGETWTCSVAGEKTVSGILVKPQGPGPFPAIIISHGKSGTPAGFSLPKAREMTRWGLVCIGPLYTHGTGDPDFADATQEGARAENIRRARLCLRIVESLAYVDDGRIAAYGNSMGAFVTIALAAAEPSVIRASAITAGGIVPSGDWPAPTVEETNPARSPFLILHGTADTTVPPQRSLLLQQVLATNAVPNERVLYQNIGHDLHQLEAADVYERIRRWLMTWQVLPHAPMDFDFDNDVDMSDFGRFQTCLTGPDIAQQDPACQSAKLDEDADVDQEDFALFQQCLSGAALSPPAACMNQ